MLRTDLPDHRRATEPELVEALRKRDPLALAEAYHRTIPAAHAAARRLLSGSAEVEALLRDVYAELWASPPQDAALEGWIRARCFSLAADDLRERDAAPASPSLTTLLPELPRPEVRYLDAAERALADLDDTQRRALLLAHDKGVPTDDQNVPDTGAALTNALLALAGPEPGGETLDASTCGDVAHIGDWVLGLLSPDQAASVAGDVNARPECSALVKALRRGRRRLEGLPPTPDMGQRILVVVLAGGPPATVPAAPAPAPAPAAPPAPSAAAGAAPLPSALDDTGDLPPVPPPDRPPPRNASSVYAELAELDEATDDDQSMHADEDTEGEAAGADADQRADQFDDDLYAPLTARRSGGGRLLVWILGALFMIAGVVAGLYLGLTLLS